MGAELAPTPKEAKGWGHATKKGQAPVPGKWGPTQHNHRHDPCHGGRLRSEPLGPGRIGEEWLSTDGQSLEAQTKQSRAAGAEEKVWRETASGAKTHRAQLRRVLGSTLATCLWSRPARSIDHKGLMFERPQKNDLDAALSLLMHASWHKLMGEVNRIKGDAIKAGTLRITASWSRR